MLLELFSVSIPHFCPPAPLKLVGWGCLRGTVHIALTTTLMFVSSFYRRPSPSSWVSFLVAAACNPSGQRVHTLGATRHDLTAD